MQAKWIALTLSLALLSSVRSYGQLAEPAASSGGSLDLSKVTVPAESVLTLTRPEAGASFKAPAEITFECVAVDPKGDIRHVEFYANGKQVGQSDHLTKEAVIPGRPRTHTFVWKAVPTGEYELVAKAKDTSSAAVASKSVKVTVKPTSQATLVIQSPKADERFAVGAVIPIQVVAMDPAGYISHVDYYDAGTKIGGSDVVFVQAPAAGTPVEHNFKWPSAGLGSHVLTARAKDTRGVEVLSGKVAVYVVPMARVVSIQATQAETMEPSPTTRIRPGAFEIKRSGDLSDVMRVFLKVGGSATPEKDYTELAHVVSIPAGKESVEIEVIPQQDQLIEGNETVVVTLMESPLSSVLPYAIDPLRNEAEVVIHDADMPTDVAFVAINSPEDGARFVDPERIEFQALTRDPKGAITRLEWYADAEKVGVSEIMFVRQPDPGTLITHTFNWKQPSVGDHKVFAVGVDAQGQKLASSPIHVAVATENPAAQQVVLDVVVSDASAAEVGADGKPDPAVFKIRRIKGALDVPVKVLFEMSGTAKNGVDYDFVSEAVELPAGQESVPVVITPVPDKALEGDETVVIKLVPPICPAIFPAPPWCYLVGDASAARAVIKDNGGIANRPPTVSVVQPKTGSVFEKGEVVSIAAEAADIDGQVARLDLLADGKLLSSAKESKLSFDWKGAEPGSHVLTARAVDDKGAETTSGRVVILVRQVQSGPFVKRDLPASYSPGLAFEVRLTVEPPQRGTAHTVEEAPPKGWTPSKISHEGVWDQQNGKVKFGPFTDHQERTLSYQILPPSTAQGRAVFEGTSSLDGVSYPIQGDRVVENSVLRHPADNAPADFVMKSDEVTAYAAAWKNGRAWPISPSAIPMSYVTRAGKLWRSGETYTYDPKQGAAPECWVNSPTPGVRLAGLANETEDAAVRNVARDGDSGSLVVTIDLPASAADGAVALQESVAKGWSATMISHDGAVDEDAKVIRWGLFLAEKPKSVTYRLTPKPGMRWLSFSGAISVDGDLSPIQGPSLDAWTDFCPHLKVQSQGQQAGRVRLRLTGPAAQLVRVEASVNLADWVEVGLRYLDDEGQLDLDEPDDATSRRFYRIRTVEE